MLLERLAWEADVLILSMSKNVFSWTNKTHVLMF